MNKPQIPANEKDRLDELKSYNILDTLPETDFDEIVELASEICAAPITLVSLVDHDRQWFKARHGLNASQTSRDVSFCGHAILAEEVFIIEDSTVDERFKDNPLVTGDPRVRFYAGAPLTTSNGMNIGTLCVIDHVPRKLSDGQIRALKTLAKQTIRQIEFRRLNRSLEGQIQALETIKATQKLTLDSVGIGTWYWNVNTGEVLWDDNQYRLYGIERADFTNDYEAWERSLHPDDKKSLLPVIDDVIHRGANYNVKFRVVTKDGQIRHIRSNALVERDDLGKATIIRGVNWDVTSEIVTSERMKLALSSFRMGTWEWDLTRNKLFWDDDLYALYGKDSNSFPDTVTAWKQSCHPDDLARTDAEIEKAIGNGTSLDTSFRVILPNGNVRHVGCHGSVTRDLDGTSLRVIAVCWDITDKKEAELQLENQRQALIHSAKMATLGEMAGGIAHEINNPLAIIGLTVESAKLICAKSADGSLRLGPLFDRIEAMVFRMAKIVRGLKAFSRDADQDPMETIAAQTLFDDTLSLIQEKLRKDSIQLKVQIEDNLMVHCRPVQISQILMNLISNSRDAIAEHEGPRWIQLTAKGLGDLIEFSVVDSGPKIPPTVAQRLMQPFFTTKPQGMGTGLGLSISFGIASQHGGSLFFDSASPQTRFVLRLPRNSKSIMTK